MGYTCLADIVHPRKLVRSAGTYVSYLTQSVYKHSFLCSREVGTDWGRCLADWKTCLVGRETGERVGMLADRLRRLTESLQKNGLLSYVNFRKLMKYVNVLIFIIY